MIKQDNDEMLSMLLGIRMDLSSKSIASRTQAYGNPAVELTNAWRQPIHRAASATVGGITASDWRRVDVGRCLQRSSSCCIDVVITPASSQPHLNFISGLSDTDANFDESMHVAGVQKNLNFFKVCSSEMSQ